MRVLITGAGLIGSHVAAELSSRGDEVTFFDVVAKPEYIRHVTGKDLPLIRGDICDLAALMDAFLTVRPECVIHLAASVGESNIPNLYAGFQVNLVATLNVAEAVRLAGVRRLVHASTQAVYQDADPGELLREDSPQDGRGRVYNASKLACEHVLRTYAARQAFELVMLRFAGVYGYRAVAGGPGVAVQEAVWAAMAREEAVLNAYETVDFIYVKDLADGIARAVHTAPAVPRRVQPRQRRPHHRGRRRRRAPRDLPGHPPPPGHAHARAAADGHHPGPDGAGIRTGVQTRSGPAGLHRRAEPGINGIRPAGKPG